KPSNFHFKNKKHRNSLKIMNFCVFISGLKIEFLPRHFFILIKNKKNDNSLPKRVRNISFFSCMYVN
ncbi:hypothetical protein, partial [Lactobacillus johnsonii]|uniref:hypothetical protein n=1 Tax=Lactobacillus johnsonii TaxID=33959 RepID=UPI002549F06C